MVSQPGFFDLDDRYAALSKVQIPTEAGRGFRFDVGQRSDLKPATIPI